jgi:hypothetical protein
MYNFVPILFSNITRVEHSKNEVSKSNRIQDIEMAVVGRKNFLGCTMGQITEP